jgi:O-antigen/teichoic acid export membrane protein
MIVAIRRAQQPGLDGERCSFAPQQSMTASQIATTLATDQALHDAPIANSAAPPSPVRSLRSRAIFGSMWMMTGYGSAQALRLAATIVLTRLIAPEVTGLMAMVTVFFIGLEMFSDVGITPSIIQNKRGSEPSFLNTAWTIQVCRGFVLWIVACIGAWPVAQFFDQPALLWVIPVVGFSAVIDGFTSTSIITMNRNLNMRPMTIMGIATQVLSYSIIITWAWFSPTVWALVAGSMVSNAAYTVGSHFILPGHRNYFHWNRDDARELFRFGRWIFFSTILTFLASQSDKIMCGKLLGAQTLGLYHYAVPIALMAPQFIKQIGMQIAFPVMSEIARMQPQEMNAKLKRVRLSLIGASLIVLVPLMLAGDRLVRILFDEQYWASGWMVQILAGGALAGIINSTYGSALLAIGKSFQISCLLAVQLVILVTSALLGYHWKGEVGFIVGLAAVEWLNYPATALVLRRYGLWQPSIDGAAFVISIAAVALALTLV